MSANEKSKSLVEQNWTGLLAITALNLIVFAAVAVIDPAPFSELATAWAFLLPAGVGLAIHRAVQHKDKGPAGLHLAMATPASRVASVHNSCQE